MLTPEQCRKIDPRLKNLSDVELLEAIKALDELADIAYEAWTEEKLVPKSTQGSA